MTKYALKVPAAERHMAFIVNRAEGMHPIHYGAPYYPYCRATVSVEKPWLTSWFIEDVTCKRCLRGLP